MKRLTQEIVREKGKGLVGKDAIDTSSAKFGKVKILDAGVSVKGKEEYVTFKAPNREIPITYSREYVTNLCV